MIPSPADYAARTCPDDWKWLGRQKGLPVSGIWAPPYYFNHFRSSRLVTKSVIHRGSYRWLQTLSWIFDRVLRVFIPSVIYRRKDRPRGCRERPHHPLARARPGRAARWCGGSLALLRLVFWHLIPSGKIGTLAFVPSNSENIYFLTFLEPKTADNRQLALWMDKG